MQTKEMLIREEIKKAAQKMESYRPGGPFSGIELALGYACYLRWLHKGIVVDKDRNSPYYGLYFERENVSARMEAIYYVGNVLRHPIIVEEINKKMNFDPNLEVQLAKAKVSNDPVFDICLTRAMILICRGLAYSFTGAMGNKFSFPPNTEFGDLVDVMEAWILENFSPSVLSTIGGLWKNGFDQFVEY